MTLEPQHLHPPLHQRHGMMEPFVIERCDNFRGKGQLCRHGFEHNRPPQFVNSKLRFVPVLSIVVALLGMSANSPHVYALSGTAAPTMPAMATTEAMGGMNGLTKPTALTVTPEQ